MKNNLFFYLILFVFIIVLGCSSDNDNNPNPINNTNSELEILFDKFAEESAKYGQTYNSSNLEMVFVDKVEVGGEEFCGYGWWDYQGTGRGRIEIANTPICWTERSVLEKELLFFHEVGHALLSRPHIENRLPNKLSASIMCGQCNQFNIFNEFQLHRRDYYMEELILGTAPAPKWGEAKNNFTFYYNENITLDNNCIYSSINYCIY